METKLVAMDTIDVNANPLSAQHADLAELVGCGLDAYLSGCPSREVLGSISDKWTMLVLSALADGTLRYGELKQQLDGISPKMLSQTLRRLERNGLVARTQYPTIPPKVTYQLTELGTRLGQLVISIKQWSEVHYPAIAAARLAYDERAAP